MRFFGKVGYGESSESLLGDGVWDSTITEREYSGDVNRNLLRAESVNAINDNLSVSNSISIVADEYAFKHFSKIKYVIWEDVRWIVNTVEVKHPRLILTLGGVYNGPTP